MTLSALDKQIISNSFSGAAHSYDSAATLQRYACEKLLNFQPTSPQGVWLDIGCGTGTSAQQLYQSSAKCIGIDMSFEMLKQAKSNSKSVLQGDAMHLPIQSQSIDGIFSSLMLQWCQPAATVFKEFARVLKPGGDMYIATLLPGTLRELASAWKTVDPDWQALLYEPAPNLIQALEAYGFKYDTQTEQKTLYFDSVKQLARELKLLGANVIPGRKSSGLMGKSKWLQMEQAYTQFYCSEGYPASYQLLFIRARKK